MENIANIENIENIFTIFDSYAILILDRLYKEEVLLWALLKLLQEQ